MFRKLLIVFVAILMIFIDTVKVPDTKFIKGEGYTGLEVVFGFKENDIAIFNFSIMALLPYLLMIVGTIFSFSNAVSKKENKVLDFTTAGLFAIAAILCFLMPSFVVCADTLAGKIAAKIDYVTTTGAIISAIASICAAAISGVKAIIKK